MKTLIINGSPRKNGDTAALIGEMLRWLEGEVIILSHEDNISPCLDCRHCREHSGCIIDDRMREIYPYLEQCDNLILASPIWFSALSGPAMNITSRIQTYFCAGYFRGEDSPIKSKNGVLMLAGAQPETVERARSIARTIMKYLKAYPWCAEVLAMKSNEIFAGDDEEAILAAKNAALLLNSKSGCNMAKN